MTLSLCGVYDSTKKTSRYYVHTHYSESANTILSILYLRIMEVLEFHQTEELSITFDNKVTAKNNLIIAFLEFLVVNLKVLKLIRLIFLVKGHTVSIQDVLNGPASTAFYSMPGMFLFSRVEYQ